MPNEKTPAEVKTPPIVTTGDVVLDRQLYQGDRIFPHQPGNVDPHYSAEIGGAFLLHSIISKTVGEGRAVFGLNPISCSDLSDLAVHTLWTPCKGGLTRHNEDLGKKDKPKDVWRVKQSLGYTRGGQVPVQLTKSAAADTLASVLVIDDADLGFRTHMCRKLWPASIDSSQPQPAWIILKMSNPLAEGDLWRQLLHQPGASGAGVRSNLIVMVSASELRRAGAAISRGLSWERTLAELCQELDHRPHLSTLLHHAGHLVVNFGCVATVWFGDTTDAAGKAPSAKHRAKLIYDPALAEGDWKTLLADYDPKEDHKVYGHLSTFTAALAVHIQSQLGKGEKFDLESAIENGLTAVRQLRLLGHGQVSNKKPAFPLDRIADLISPEKDTVRTEDAKRVAPAGYEHIAGLGSQDAGWTLAALSENPANNSKLPLYGLAHCVALYGEPALQHIPHARFGKLLSIDRDEIETLRSLSRLISAYETGGRQKQPLCLAAFGPPGAGKSFGIKEIAAQIMKDAPILEFNLSQYNDSSELIGAFHDVRDKCLQGYTPVVFWDEFDASEYKWLQYLLAPMQDGTFQENGHTHTLGKCIFVFAGGTSWDFEHFGPAPMPDSHDKNAANALAARYEANPALKKAEDDANVGFRKKKGPDFISRLDGHINVLGPNPRLEYNWTTRLWETRDSLDITFPVRRALLLRVFLGMKKPGDHLQIDRDLLRAFLRVPRYCHGSRSLEKISRPLATTSLPYRRAHLPPLQVLEQHLETLETFDAVYHQNREFLSEENVRKIAAAIKDYYDRKFRSAEGERTAERAQDAFEASAARSDPWEQWLVATNLAAAQRLPYILSLAGLELQEGTATEAEQEQVSEHLGKHLHRLAQEEHDLWMEFHLSNGWRQVDKETFEQLEELRKSNKDAYNKEITRLKKNEHTHTLLRLFDELSDGEKDKDHDAIKNYPHTVALVDWKIAFIKQ